MLSKKYIIDCGLITILIFSIGVVTSEAVSASTALWLLRKFIVSILALYITQKAVGERLLQTKNIIPLFVAGCWIAYVFFKWMALHDETYYDNEILFSVYILSFLTLLQHLVYNIKYKFLSLFYYIISFIITMLPLVTIGHYFIYGTGISIDEMDAVYHTTLRESYEWWITYVGIMPCVMLIAIWCGIVKLMSNVNSYLQKCYNQSNIARSKKQLAVVFVLMIAAIIYPCRLLGEMDWTGLYLKTAKYNEHVRDYKNRIDEYKQNLQLIDDKMIVDDPHTIVIVVGESSARDCLKAYNNAFPYDNTPWMGSCMSDSNFIVFSNAYGCHSLTQQVVPRALSESSYYNNKDFLECMNIMDVASKKGYKTYWITNWVGTNISTFGEIALRADNLYHRGMQYDDGMLEYLSEINPKENNLVIFHGDGSHAKYSGRYPKDREVFHDDNVEAEYANATLYVDTFLKKIYEYGKDNLNMQVMVYFSDHGENLLEGHGPGNKTFDKVRIPMFIYLGEQYQKNNPEKTSVLRSNVDTYYTNDMIYNTMCGIMRSESNYYDITEDISSKDFNHPLESLLTFGGERKVTDDPNLKKNVNQ